jgi:hypothetical protein
MSTIYKKRKIIKAAEGFDFSQFKNLFSKSKKTTAGKTGEELESGASGLSSMSSMTGNVDSSMAMASKAYTGITGDYWNHQGGRYGLDQVGVGNDKTAMVGNYFTNAAKNNPEYSGELEGIGRMINGFNAKSEGNGVDQEYGIKYKTYKGSSDGNPGVGDIIGGSTEALGSGILQYFGVPGKTAGKIGHTMGDITSGGINIAADNLSFSKGNVNNSWNDFKKGKIKSGFNDLTVGSSNDKRNIEQRRIMNVRTGIQQDRALNQSFDDYATLMPKYDKTSMTRYAKKGGTIYPTFKKGGSIKTYGAGDKIKTFVKKIFTKKSQTSPGTSRQLDESESVLDKRGQNVAQSVNWNTYHSDQKGVYRNTVHGKVYVAPDEAVMAMRTGKLQNTTVTEKDPLATYSGKSTSRGTGYVEPEEEMIDAASKPAIVSAKPAPVSVAGKYLKFAEMTPDMQKQYRAGIASGKDFVVNGARYKGVAVSQKPSQVVTPKSGQKTFNTMNFASGNESGGFNTVKTTQKIGSGSMQDMYKKGTTPVENTVDLDQQIEIAKKKYLDNPTREAHNAFVLAHQNKAKAMMNNQQLSMMKKGGAIYKDGGNGMPNYNNGMKSAKDKRKTIYGAGKKRMA